MRPIVRRYAVTTTLGLLSLVLLVANSLVIYTRLDLTERRIHTISEATSDVLEGLDHTLTITYYVSDRLRDRYPQPREMIDLLREYEATGRGSVRLRVVDPRELDDPATVEALGVVPQQLQTSEEGEQSVAVVYSGIVLEHLDRRESLPFVFGSTTLEYELTSAAVNLLRDDPRDVVFVLGNRSERLDDAYRVAATELARSFDVSTRLPGEAIADATEVAVVTDAQRLSSQEVDAIADYLSRGGGLLLTVDGVEVEADAEAEASRAFAATPSGAAPVFGVLRDYGIVAGRELLLDESHNRITVSEASEGGSFRVTRTYAYPHWISVLEQYTSATHPVTARFAGLDLYWPGWLAVEPASEAEIIAASTPAGWLMREPYVLEPGREADLRNDAEATRGQYGVVAVLAGAADGRGRLAVVSDSDFLRDALMSATGSAHNIEFTRDLVEWLGNDEALLGIRSRMQRDLALDEISEPARERTVRFMARAVNVVIVPGAVTLLGVVRLLRRRRRSRRGGAL
ncbi:MAG: Gldg family protein [bacterium]